MKLPPILYVLTGLPGSGKTTWAQALNQWATKKGPMVTVLHRDEIRDVFGDYSPQKESCVYGFMKALTQGLLLAGEIVVIDSTALGERQRARYRSWAEEIYFDENKNRIRTCSIYFPSSIEESIERRQNTIPADRLRQMADQLVEPTTLEGFYEAQRMLQWDDDDLPWPFYKEDLET